MGISTNRKTINIESSRKEKIAGTHKIIYESEFSFQPIIGEIYYLYQKENKSYWLSIVSPENWNKKYIGSFKLLTNGKWEKVSKDER